MRNNIKFGAIIILLFFFTNCVQEQKFSKDYIQYDMITDVNHNFTADFTTMKEVVYMWESGLPDTEYFKKDLTIRISYDNEVDTPEGEKAGYLNIYIADGIKVRQNDAVPIQYIIGNNNTFTLYPEDGLDGLHYLVQRTRVINEDGTNSYKYDVVVSTKSGYIRYGRD